MWDEIEEGDGRKRTAPPRDAVVMDVAPTVEDFAAVMGMMRNGSTRRDAVK